MTEEHAVQGLETTCKPYSMREQGGGRQVIWKDECILDTNLLDKAKMTTVVRHLNDAFQEGFRSCAAEILNG